MVFHFVTASGSTYRVDSARHTIERLPNAASSTPRVGKGPREYERLGEVGLGCSVVVFWPTVDRPTITTPVVSMGLG